MSALNAQPLAIFDLDNTLIKGDSDYAWGEFLVAKGLVDPAYYAERNQGFYEDYQHAKLDIHEYIAFVSEPIRALSAKEFSDLHKQFMDDVIRSLYLPAAHKLLKQHHEAGDYLLIITATNQWVAEPIGLDLGVDEVLATQLEVVGGQVTGKIDGTPCFQDGKVLRLQQWLKSKQYQPGTMHFYSDSINDRSLLEYVDYPVVVDGDALLLEHAKICRWPCISLRD